VETVLFLVLLFPLAGGVLNAVAGRYLPRRAVEALACAAVFLSFAMAALALGLAGQQTVNLTFFDWIVAGEFSAAMSVHFDPLAAVMALMVTFVSGLIHLYSVAFMREDRDYVRYFSYLNLFVFAMLVITLADNLIFVYLGWEGVGFCSYILIAFWYSEVANATAGRKAFVLTRLGDVAFGVALALFFLLWQNFSISFINAHVSGLSPTLATVLALLLLWAAVGKSAQLPLTVWLPDAMAGPTPVSALIHAATMVTAGVYLLMRLFPLVQMSPSALLVIAGVGALTTLYAAAAACAQIDIKRILAYSTISQVGYMILAVGAGDIIGGMFHLLSHAFFKALLFMAAGCVIQALAEEHNIFKMGNLNRLLPAVSWIFLAGCLCLSAFPLLGGYFSKDRILLATFLHPEPFYRACWAVAAAAALLTPFYSFRLYFLVFGERPGGRRREEIVAIPRFMVWVLWPLVLLALGDGLLNLPGGVGKNFLGYFLAPVPGARPDLGASVALEWAMGIGTASLTLLMIVLTYWAYRPPGPALAWPGLQKTLLEGCYLDRLYLQVIARPYQALARFFWLRVDEGGLDQGWDRTAAGLGALSGLLGLWTTGRLSTYLKMLFLGLTVMFAVLAITWYW
jgi:NADH-quinone oxidoreductase subunit L